MSTKTHQGRKKMQPIRDRKKITEVKEWLLLKKDTRYSFLFTLGVNTGLRVSDLLKLRVSDVKDKQVIYLYIEKTKRELEIPLNAFIQKEIEEYIKFSKEDDYLFPSRVGVNRPLTRQMISQVFREAAAELDIERMNTHTMRKSFGYWYYKQHNDVYFLMKLFGHNTQSQTLDYIGIESEEIAKTIKNFSLGDD